MRGAFLFSDSHMEKHAQLSLLASLGLHILLIGIWEVQHPHAQMVASAGSGERRIEVYLQSSQAGALHGRRATAQQAATVLSSSPVTVLPDHGIPELEPISHLVRTLPSEAATYIPAGELDERPIPEAPVIVPFPDVLLQEPKVSGVLVLYIGSDGKVDRVEVDDSDLPPEFEKAAVESFLQARMRPGIIKGQLARTRMKILVEFEQR